MASRLWAMAELTRQALRWHGTPRRHLQEMDEPNQAFLLLWTGGSTIVPDFIWHTHVFAEAVAQPGSGWRLTVAKAWEQNAMQRQESAKKVIKIMRTNVGNFSHVKMLRHRLYLCGGLSQNTQIFIGLNL